MISRPTTALLIAAALILPLGAQQRPPEFRSGVDLVTLDVSAIGPDGWPVTDLRADELTLTVKDRARPIKSLAYVEVAPRTGGAPAKGAPAVPAAASSNVDTAAGRSVFILVLHDHIRQGNERQALQGAARFIDQLTPRDRVALITLPFGRVEADLTTDHTLVKARLSKIVGHRDAGTKTTPESRAVIDLLKQIAPLEGPKTIVLVSEGFSGDNSQPFETDPAAAGDVLNPLQPDSGAAAMSDTAAMIDGITGLRSAALAARAQFYVIQPNNFARDAAFKPTVPGAPNEEKIDANVWERGDTDTAALATLATMTGGQFFRLSGTATAVFDRVLRESSGYYTLAFEADEVDRAGKDQTIRLRTSRPGVTIRARRTFARTSGSTPAATSAPMTAKDMLKDALPHRDLPLQVLAYAARAPQGKVKIVSIVEAPPGAALAEIAFALIDGTGKVVEAWPVDVPAAPGPIVAAQVVAPGHYRLRAAVVDANKRGGAADYEFDAGLTTAGPLRASSLMLGTIGATGRFQARLSFQTGESATPYVEIYGTDKDVVVSFELRAASSPDMLVNIPGDVTTTADADRRVASGVLPLGGVPPGDYIVRASISTGGREPGIVSAPLRVIAR